ncbi:hypothetical protein CRUP_034101 [Coryphaenoides rupestris]|nr:hypothetical protein CRUP_034101 [Coryphaenoides rupestris]
MMIQNRCTAGVLVELAVGQRVVVLLSARLGLLPVGHQPLVAGLPLVVRRITCSGSLSSTNDEGRRARRWLWRVEVCCLAGCLKPPNTCRNASNAYFLPLQQPVLVQVQQAEDLVGGQRQEGLVGLVLLPGLEGLWVALGAGEEQRAGPEVAPGVGAGRADVTGAAPKTLDLVKHMLLDRERE